MPRRPRWDEEDHGYRRRSDGDGWAAGAFIAGLVSLLIFCLWPVGLVTSVAGLAMGAAGLKSRSRGLAVTGLVFSCVGLTFAAGVGVTMVVVIAAEAAKGK